MKKSLYLFAALIFSLVLLQNESYSQTKENTKTKTCCSSKKISETKTAESACCSDKTAKQNTGNKSDLKAHSCNSECTQEKHIYKHGEKGHVCDAACKAEMMKSQKQTKKAKSDTKKK